MVGTSGGLGLGSRHLGVVAAHSPPSSLLFLPASPPTLSPSTRLVLGGGIRKRITPPCSLLTLQTSEGGGGGDTSVPYLFLLGLHTHEQLDTTASSVGVSSQATSQPTHLALALVAGYLLASGAPSIVPEGCGPGTKRQGGSLVAWAGIERLVFLLSALDTSMHTSVRRCWALNSGLGLFSCHSR